jgi:nucleotidyltransferase substrate binding protein (TIGR01987 family)
MEPDIRLRQRFQNFRRAFMLLRESLEDNNVNSLSALEKEGIIKRFEYAFELGWKTLKDYLEYTGVTLAEITPRHVIKGCASAGILEEAGIDPQLYMDMMLVRSALSQTYDFNYFQQVIILIQDKYLYELKKENDYFIQSIM